MKYLKSSVLRLDELLRLASYIIVDLLSQKCAFAVEETLITGTAPVVSRSISSYEFVLEGVVVQVDPLSLV